jgi:hypothetical protein
VLFNALRTVGNFGFQHLIYLLLLDYVLGNWLKRPFVIGAGRVLETQLHFVPFDNSAFVIAHEEIFHITLVEHRKHVDGNSTGHGVVCLCQHKIILQI